jgi:hypothetical protein
MTTDPTTTTTRFARKVRLGLATLIAGTIGILGVAAPASAGNVQVYASSTINAMWHSGSTQYTNANQRFTSTVRFNDRGGDNFCTQLRVRAYQSNGYATTFNEGSVCGGRAGTISTGITAYPGTTITKVEIWTVRADGAIQSYVWAFRP